VGRLLLAGRDRTPSSLGAVLLLAFMAVLAGGAALRESVTIDEVSHIGSGVSYLQTFDLRLNEEHPPLPKVLAALPLVLSGTHADYSHASWTVSDKFFPAFLGQWVFGEWLLERWNDPVMTLALARFPMLLLTLVLGFVIFVLARRLGGDWGGLLCLCVYVTTPLFIVFGPLVHTDIAVTLFTLLTLWTFAEVWRNPTRKGTLRFGICLAGALLSKFTAGILLFAFGALALSTRWRSLPDQPAAKTEARAWRRLRWSATRKGILWAAAGVYCFYFILSIRQSTDALDLVGQGSAVVPVRRLLMPPWLYLRGVLMVLLTSSRPTFLLGRIHSHGIWFYFPVVFLLKSSLGFLGLLVLAPVVALKRKGLAEGVASVIPVELTVHWRALWTGLLVFSGACLLSRMTISIRHFSVPTALLILLLAPLPRLVSGLKANSPWVTRFVAALTAVLAMSCLVTTTRAYPFFFPYVNALGLGHPAYSLMSDSNVDWNQALPEVRRFAERRHLQRIPVDAYGFTDPALALPQAELWDCQRPANAEAGQWVVVSANMLLDAHNCSWLLRYPQESIAGGSMYAVRLPPSIPAAGSPGGPPLPTERREFLGAPFDLRSAFIGYTRNPDRLPKTNEELQAIFTRPSK
jgi:4-amino-4-deoxy-L-arabinose transferase-like glycosyltransferase